MIHIWIILIISMLLMGIAVDACASSIINRRLRYTRSINIAVNRGEKNRGDFNILIRHLSIPIPWISV